MNQVQRIAEHSQKNEGIPQGGLGVTERRSGPIKYTAPAPAKPMPANLSTEGGSRRAISDSKTVKTGMVVTRIVAFTAVVCRRPQEEERLVGTDAQKAEPGEPTKVATVSHSGVFTPAVHEEQHHSRTNDPDQDQKSRRDLLQDNAAYDSQTPHEQLDQGQHEGDSDLQESEPRVVLTGQSVSFYSHCNL